MPCWHYMCFLRGCHLDNANDSCYIRAGTKAVAKQPLQPSTELNTPSVAAPVPAKQPQQSRGALLGSCCLH